MKSKFKTSGVYIKVNDIFDELSEENKRLNNELMFANNCLNILNKFKIFLNKILNKFEAFIESEDKQELNQLENEFNSIIKSNEKIEESNVKILCQVIDEQINDKTTVRQNKSNEEKTKSLNKKPKKGKQKRKKSSKDMDSDYEVSDGTDYELDLINKSSDQELKHKKKKTNSTEKKTTFVCNYVGCDERFKQNNFLNQHIQRIHTFDKQFKCTECEKSYVNDSALKYHQQIHSAKTLECDICHKLFNRRVNFISHQKIHLKNRTKHSCDLCGSQLTSEKGLRKHIRLKHSTNNKTFECDFKDCHKVFKNIIYLRAHKSSVHRTDLFSCNWPGCEQQFKSNQGLNEHIKRVHTLDKAFKCTECDKRYIKEYELKNHQLIHSGNTIQEKAIYVCNYVGCDKRFKIRARLKQHIQRIHTLDKPFKCIECEKRFVTKYELSCHKLIHSAKTLECDICHKLFNRRLNLSSHQRIHLKNRTEHCCDLCGSQLTSEEGLRNHILLQHSTNNKTFECHYKDCHKVFKNRKNLNAHKNGYHRTDLFLCDWPECGQQFKYKAKFDNHKKYHLGINEYKCDVDGCGKAFVSKVFLNQHREYHQKMFVCLWPECGQRFVDNEMLSVHTNRHQNIKPFKCTFNGCPKEYFSRLSLRFHLKNFVHKNQINV